MNQAKGCLPDLRFLIGDLADRDAPSDGADCAPSLPDFLGDCAHSLTTERGPGLEQFSDEFCRARDVFVRAGLEALAAQPWRSSEKWLQIGIRPLDDLRARSELNRQVACLARRLLSDSAVDNFFFLNKPPGIRLRFGTASGRSFDLATVVDAEVTRWHSDGLIDYVEPGVYEPETQLFGGPRSMDFVHALFTVDSLIWLDYHSLSIVDGEAISPAWLVSLALLRRVFDGLDITGWEDIGVWDRIRKVAGRRLGDTKARLPMYASVGGQLRDVWSQGNQIVDGLHPVVKTMVDRNDSALLTGAARWRSGYFCQQRASLGPRAAAAFYVIFHWNRAGLSRTEQALLAESLSERIRDDVRG